MVVGIGGALTAEPAGWRFTGTYELRAGGRGARSVISPTTSRWPAATGPPCRCCTRPWPAAGAPLAVVPHGPLFAVPFAALLDRDDGGYLLQRYALVVLPSIGTIRAAGLTGTAPPRPDRLLALARQYPDQPLLWAAFQLGGAWS